MITGRGILRRVCGERTQGKEKKVETAGRSEDGKLQGEEGKWLGQSWMKTAGSAWDPPSGRIPEKVSDQN